MKKKIVIMNFTGVYDFEPFSKNRHFVELDCSHIQSTDCYCEKKSEERIKEIIAPYSAEGIHFIDSGDFHYVTKFWTDKIDRPFSLIVFDHHPDMQPPLFPEILSCGDWVKEMLDQNPYLRKVVIVGAADRLIRSVPAGYEDRVRFYSEQSLEHESTWRRFSKGYLKEPVYISIDKDVLDRKDAVTNWDQGSMDLRELEILLGVILKKEKVIGIDICGENSPLNDLMEEETGAEVDNETNRNLLRFLLDRFDEHDFCS